MKHSNEQQFTNLRGVSRQCSCMRATEIQKNCLIRRIYHKKCFKRLERYSSLYKRCLDSTNTAIKRQLCAWIINLKITTVYNNECINSNRDQTVHFCASKDETIILCIMQACALDIQQSGRQYVTGKPSFDDSKMMSIKQHLLQQVEDYIFAKQMHICSEQRCLATSSPHFTLKARLRQLQQMALLRVMSRCPDINLSDFMTATPL